MSPYGKTDGGYAKVFAVAPMMDWTDRHCRFLHRQLTRRALLYTEMVVADALLHGNVEHLLGFDGIEHPVALQLGGSDPSKLARAAAIGAAFGHDEVNLNVGCPSDRVQSGTFGACLMREPGLVARCVAAMKEAVDVPVTVKCRLGVDEQDTQTALDGLADAVVASGCNALWVHARKAWLQGLSPKENRDVPPLDYARVYRLKQRLPDVFVGINGGVNDTFAAQQHLQHVDGVMIGRAAYRTPDMLRFVDASIYGVEGPDPDADALCEAMTSYAAAHIARGGRVGHVTRHMVGFFSGQPGARAFRRVLSEEAVKPGVDETVIARAFAAFQGQALAA